MHAAAVITARCAWLTYNVAAESVCHMMPLPQLMTHAASMPAVACTALSYCHVNPLVVVHAPASCGRGLEGDGRSILEVMRRRQRRHSRLSALAKRLLAIPCSSVPSERMFSTAGQIVTDQRSRLAPDSVSRLLFLNKNSDL